MPKEESQETGKKGKVSAAIASAARAIKGVNKKEIALSVAFVAVIILLALAAQYLLNAPGNGYFNNQDIAVEGQYEFHSYANGLGHVEYLKFADGEVQIEDHSSLGTSNWGYRDYSDDNGDGKVDVITQHGSGSTYYRMKYILTRNADYDDNQQEFDKADALLRELNEKY